MTAGEIIHEMNEPLITACTNAINNIESVKAHPKDNRKPDLCESRIKIRFVPLPPEKRAGYEAALRWLVKLMMEDLQKAKANDQKTQKSTT